MFRWRNLISVSLLIISVSQVIGAEIQLVPAEPERGKPLSLSLDDSTTKNQTWNVLWKMGIETRKLVTNEAKPNIQLADLQPGEYTVQVSYKTSDNKDDFTFRSFSVLSENQERADAADAALDNVKEITQERVKSYLSEKVRSDEKYEYTAFLLSKKLKEIIQNNQDIEDENIIYDLLKKGTSEVVEKRIAELPDDLNPVALDALQEGLRDWNKATEHLIERLKESTQSTAEMMNVLNTVVLPALGAESVPIKDREFKTPAPPLSADTMLRILQQTRGVRTVPVSPRRRHGCCGILLGF